MTSSLRANIRIAFCISSFRAGGGEKQVIEIANAFAARGHTVDLLVLKPVGQYKEKVDARVNVVSLDAGRIIFSLPKLIFYLRRERPEALLALDEYTHLLALMARILSGARTRIVLRIGNMLTELFKRYHDQKSKIILPFLIKRLYKRADGIIANSRGVADDVIKVTGADKNNVSVISNPKDIGLIRSLAKERAGHVWLERKTLPVIMAVGRLRVQKNLPLLIGAFSKVAKEIPSRLIIVGGGREEGRLRDFIRSLQAENIISLTGYMDNPHAYMGKADMFVSASLWEGMPNSVLEAMACGLPIIASDCSSGPREILAPETDYRFRLKNGVEYAKYGVLTAVNDEDALTQAMIKLLSDAESRAKYASLSEERAKNFDSKKIIGEYARALGLNN